MEAIFSPFLQDVGAMLELFCWLVIIMVFLLFAALAFGLTFLYFWSKARQKPVIPANPANNLPRSTPPPMPARNRPPICKDVIGCRSCQLCNQPPTTPRQ